MEHPCIHRIHSSKEEVPSSYHELGMSIEIGTLLSRLRSLHKTNILNNESSMVTFDDGWNDVFSIPDQFFLEHSTLTPVVFLTDEQLGESNRWMPLHALYAWMDELGYGLKDLPSLGIDRGSLKDLRETDQHDELSARGVAIEGLPAYLSLAHVEVLKNRGWAIASHGPEHSDLRAIESNELREMLSESLERLKNLEIEPWLAWPEGRWNDAVAALAQEVGFTRQFGLEAEVRKGTSEVVEMRTIW